MPKPFPLWFEKIMWQSVALIAGRGTHRNAWAKDAYQLWLRGLLARPCAFWKLRTEAPPELECTCQGCFQRRCFSFFEQAKVTFDQLPEPEKAR